jgi:hypothetical protein
MACVRAHEPVNPFGFALLAGVNQAAAFAGMSQAMVLTAKARQLF